MEASPLKVVVITGSSRGLGYGLAENFLGRGCGVVIHGRNPDTLRQAYDRLVENHGADRLESVAGDVRQFPQVQALWDRAWERFGRVDIWINNAGAMNPRRPVWEQDAPVLEDVLSSNLLGTAHGAKVAIAGMLRQGFGQVYTLEGEGTQGNKMPGMTLYCTTKYAVRYLTEALIQETQGTPVQVGSISPGIVVTDLLLGQYEDQTSPAWKRAKFMLNILADRVETVAPWLVDQILANDRPGTRIAWLTRPKAWQRMLLSPWNPRNLFEES